MNFKYTALGTNHQKLEGILEAGSIDDARERLHKMGLSVVAINEFLSSEESTLKTVDEKNAQTSITTYYFLAQDGQKKEINGTIDAKDPYLAYKRLVTEYQFDVLDLYPENTDDKKTFSSKSEFEKWRTQMEEEGLDLSKKPVFGVKEELEEESEKMSEAIESEIDGFIVSTKKILKTHRNQYSEAFLAEIEKTLNELERIRSSNNLKHITRICNDLYELISNPDSTKTEEGQSQEYEKSLNDLQENGFVANHFQFVEAHNLKKKAANFEKIQKLFSKINKTIHLGKNLNSDQQIEENIKTKDHHWGLDLSKIFEQKNAPGPDSFKYVIYKFFSYLQSSNGILKRAKKQEMIKAYRFWKENRKQIKRNKQAIKPIPESSIETVKSDFSGFFTELDSFVGWLLFFYVGYFFLADFALEKNIGLPQDLVLKTFASPLLLNISIFLVIAHLSFSLKLKIFRRNFFGSLFLFFLSFGLYGILIINF